MARKERIKSSTGIYHIMIRGNNRQNIFEDDEDREKILFDIRELTNLNCLKVYAYALMSNHIHILAEEEKENISQFMKRIENRYDAYYKRKYKYSGHVFQGRFKSEPVEDDAYFITAVRYIHQNPVKAGVCRSLEESRWTSWEEYSGEKKSICNKEYVYEVFGGREVFIKKNYEECTVKCLEDNTESKRYTDKDLREFMKEEFGIETLSEFQGQSRERKEIIIVSMLKNRYTLNRISRVTGANYGMVRHVAESM